MENHIIVDTKRPSTTTSTRKYRKRNFDNMGKKVIFETSTATTTKGNDSYGTY